MTIEKLTNSEVLQIEAQVDRHFDRTSLPTSDLNTARWVVCAVNEDVNRLALLDAVKTWYREDARANRARFVGRLDRSKYALRHALDLCAKHLPLTNVCGLIHFNAENYTPACHLLASAEEFAAATRVFSAYHAKALELSIDRETGLISALQEKWASHYGSLEYVLNADKGEFSPVILLVNLFSGPSFEMPGVNSFGGWGPTIYEIVKRARLKKGRIHYQLIKRFARELFEEFNVTPSLLSKKWVFPWGTMPEAQSYFAALQAVSVYHLLSVHFGSIRRLNGRGVDQICLNTEARRLNADLARVSGLPIRTVEAVTDALTLGSGTTTPDPALQPLVPIGDARLAVPGSVILSSKWSRNMLSLHARVAEDSFNANSAAFEQTMISVLESELPARFIHRTSINIPTSKGPEEIDLLLIDKNARSILLGELRWMLQPGDVREVLNRKKVIREKVKQAHRKLAGARAATDEVVQQLGLPPGAWTINAVVIIDGFGGTVSDRPKDIPVVPRDVFIRVVDAALDLDHAHAVMTTPLWLPREGFDFERQWAPTTMCGISYNRPGIDFGHRSYIRESLQQYLAEAFKFSVPELRSMPW